MQRIVNQEEARVLWGLNNWAEKTVYIVGFATAVIVTLSFVIGFIAGIVQNIQG